MKHALVALLAIPTLLGCGKAAKPDPISIARSNLVQEYTLLNGSMVELADYGCYPPVRKARNGEGYAKCDAIVKGFVHAEIHFCSTVERGGCSSSRPEE